MAARGAAMYLHDPGHIGSTQQETPDQEQTTEPPPWELVRCVIQRTEVKPSHGRSSQADIQEL